MAFRHREDQVGKRFGRRFIAALLAPVLMLALGLTIVAVPGFAQPPIKRTGSCRAAGARGEAAIEAAPDESAQSQTGVAIWNPLTRELWKPRRDWAWTWNGDSSQSAISHLCPACGSTMYR